MAIKLGGGLVDAVITYLTANLPAQLDAEELVWADGLALPDMTQIVRREPDQPERVTTPPYLYVIVDRSNIYDWRSDYAESSHALVAWIVTAEQDPDTLRKLMYRYGNALWKALTAYSVSQGVYKMASPEGGSETELDFGMSITSGSMAMADVRIESTWTVREVT